MEDLPLRTAYADLNLGAEFDTPRLDFRANIIIVNFNSGEYLTRCLESLYATVLFGVEIIVVDNASTDGSIGKVRYKFPQVRLITSQTNLGFGGACNLAARVGVGEYLAFLNPDTVVMPGWLDALIAALDGNPAAGLATSKILLHNTLDRINTCGNDVHISGLTLCRGMGASWHEFIHVQQVSAVSGAAFVIRRELFELLGGFDESFFLYMEDTDLSWRARLAGWYILYIPQSLVFHDYKLCFGPYKIFYQERNRYYMLLKCLQWRTLLALLPVLLLSEIITWGFCMLHAPTSLCDKFRAYASLLSNWQALMRARSQTQNLRRVSDGVLLRSTGHSLMFEQTCNGALAHLAHRIFDPLFAICRAIALMVVRSGD